MKKIISFTIATFFIFLAFGSGDNVENVSNSSEESSTEKHTSTIYLREGWSPSQKIEIDLTPPEGYEKGMTCMRCGGSGTKMYPGDSRESICASCNGRGFDFKRK